MIKGVEIRLEHLKSTDIASWDVNFVFINIQKGHTVVMNTCKTSHKISVILALLWMQLDCVRHRFRTGYNFGTFLKLQKNVNFNPAPRLLQQIHHMIYTML